MDTNEILNNLKRAFGVLCRQRLIISSTQMKVADVPLVYAILLVLAAPWVCALAFVLGLIRRYDLRIEQELERRK